MRFSPPLFFTVTAFALLLCGCISSKILLFDEANAVTPAPAGRYDELKNNNGNWIKRGTGTLRLDARGYGWKEDRATSEQLFALFDIGNGFYVAAGRRRNPKLDGTDCFYIEREAVVQVLRLWAERMLPTYRYIAARP